MIIIRPALEDNKDSILADNAARAPFFLVFDDEHFVKSIKNPFVTWGGAGFAVVDLLKSEWCELFIAKKIWDNMKNALDNNAIAYKIVN